MDRAHLERLSRDQLIELIWALQGRIEQLEVQVADLQGRLSQPPKTPANSSVPPAQGSQPQHTPRADGPRKRGPHPGHPGSTRERREPDVQVVVKVAQCPRCGQQLGTLAQRVVARRQLVDLPPMHPLVWEAQVCQVRCPQCGQCHQASFPAPFAAPPAFGPRIHAVATSLHEVQHVAYARLAQVLSAIFGLALSPGSLVNLVRRSGRTLASQAAAIREEVRQSAVIGSDETGARVDGANQWQWVLRTPQASYDVIVPSRGSQVIAEVLGEARPAVWLSDRWSAQQQAPAAQFQLCHAHQLRDLEFAKDGGDRTFAPAMHALLRQSQQLARAREALSPEAFATRRQAIHQECDTLLAEETVHPEGQQLQRRYRQHRDKLFVFLERTDVPPDHNGAERDLRHSVIHRNVTGGFRSAWAPQTFATVTTVIETAKQRGQGVFATLVAGVGRTLPAPTTPALTSGAPP